MTVIELFLSQHNSNKIYRAGHWVDFANPPSVMDLHVGS